MSSLHKFSINVGDEKTKNEEDKVSAFSHNLNDSPYPFYLPKVNHNRTLEPVTTGASVLGITYKDGVLLTADTLVSYGKLARFRGQQRIRGVGKGTLIAASGEFSDFQHMLDLLDQLMTTEYVLDDGSKLTPAEIHSYLGRVLYNRRNRFDPYYNQILIAGIQNEKPFLGYLDLVGTIYTDTTLATGYGAYIARPLLRNAWKPDLSEEEATQTLKSAMKVLYYRDGVASNQIQLAKVTVDGYKISEPYTLTETNWQELAALSYSY